MKSDDYRNDPAAFFRALSGVEPSEQQVALLRALSERKTAVSTMRSGKSVCYAVIDLYLRSQEKNRGES